MPNGLAYDPARLRRAARLPITRVGPTEFVVKGHDEFMYHVDLAGDPPCYCLDYQHRGGPTNPCKHTLAARLASGELPLLLALGEMLAKAERYLAEMEKAG